jgi:hypothetical protein
VAKNLYALNFSNCVSAGIEHNRCLEKFLRAYIGAAGLGGLAFWGFA